MNLQILKGNIGQDPQIRTFEWGKTASFSLATTESYKNKAGERITETDWHNIVFRGAVVDVIEKHLHKGDQVLVTGKSKTRKYTGNDGQEHWTTEVICDTFEFCGSPKKEPEKLDNNEGKFQKNGAVSKDDILNMPDDPKSAELSDLPF